MTVLSDVEDNGWEEVYRANGVRCDIETKVSSQGEVGVCPAPLANPLFILKIERERSSIPSAAPLETFI